MEPKVFSVMVEETLHDCQVTLSRKEDEYSSGKDRFHNFNVGARMRNCTPIQALEGMKLKHDVSIKDMIDNPDMVTTALLDAKINDEINYLLLLKGMFVDLITKSKVPKMPATPHITKQ